MSSASSLSLNLGLSTHLFVKVHGGGATRPLLRDRGVEELHGDPTIGPCSKVWTRIQEEVKVLPV